MSTIVRFVSSDLNQLNDLSILQELLSALYAAGILDEDTPQLQFTTELPDSPKEEIQGEVTVDSEEMEFSNLVRECAKDLPMKEASRILNKNAWKIKGLILIPGFGEDPETEWTGFMELLDSHVEGGWEFWVEADDYREILKRFALVSETVDFGE